MTSILLHLSERRSTRMVFVAGLALSLMATTASAAVAQDPSVGTSAGVGSETAFVDAAALDEAPGPITPFCQGVAYSKYEVEVTGIFTGTQPGGPLGLPLPVTYAGPATVHFEMGSADNIGADPEDPSATDWTAAYYVAPEGTYGPSGCSLGTLGPLEPIPTKVWVTSPTHGIVCGDATNNALEGDYFRVNTAFTVTWEGPCVIQDSVSGQSGTTPAGTQHVFVGNLVPCLPLPPPDGLCGIGAIGDIHLQGDWTYAGG